MKNILAVMILACSTAVQAQEVLHLAGRNTINIVFQPTDLGIGLRYVRQITDIGIYGSASWGNYRFDNGGRIYDHVKLSVGFIKYIQRSPSLTNTFSLGFSYHSFGAMRHVYIPLPDRATYPLSVDIGTGVRINRFDIGFAMDFIKWESVINIGYVF